MLGLCWHNIIYPPIMLYIMLVYLTRPTSSCLGAYYNWEFKGSLVSTLNLWKFITAESVTHLEGKSLLPLQVMGGKGKLDCFNN